MQNLVSIAVVIGGQYGSEGKGKVVVRLIQNAIKSGYRKIISIRCGGPNAGHTVYVGNNPVVMRQIPSGIVVPGVTGIIPSGAMVDPELLNTEFKNLSAAGMDANDFLNRLYVSTEAAVVQNSALAGEKEIGLGERIGSTQTGTGWTAAQKILRRCDLVRDIALPAMSLDTTWWLNNQIEHSHIANIPTKIIVEGTQGFGLSLHHSGHYPYCTSKDTSASQFISEAGLPMPLVDEIHMVIRTWPIRVGGNSGPMLDETSWQVVAQQSGYGPELIEMTSVTKKVRRVGRFDWNLLKKAVQVNLPTHLWVHGMDYVNFLDMGKREYSNLSEESRHFLDYLQDWCGEIRPRWRRLTVAGAFTGKRQDDIVDTMPVYRRDEIDPETGIF